MSLPADPIAEQGLAGFAAALRKGTVTAEAATRAYLDRIAALEPQLGAFEHIAPESALATARALDNLLAAGTDLGPLMGVPIAVKDLLAVDGMPTTAGSNLEVTDLIGPQGSFVAKLKELGCVILGKTKTVEFALGGAGTNRARGTPRNPWDMQTFRVPGGSSSGSAVAMAAGLCALAVGSDTGGSVRGPAAFCGVFGLKTTKGLWPTDGVYPLSPTLDTIGFLTASAADCAAACAALDGTEAPAPAPAKGLRLGRPTNHFFDNLDADVARATERALDGLERAGVTLVPMEVPDVRVADDVFYDLLAAEFIAILGRERFLAGRGAMDRDVGNWGATGLEITSDRYLHCLWAQQDVCRRLDEWFGDVDGWVHPTRPIVAQPKAAYDDANEYKRLARLMAQNTRFSNIAGLCAASIPVQPEGAALPVGLHIACRPFHERKLLGIARLVEDVIGKPPRPAIATA